jgi:hypothetical protein
MTQSLLFDHPYGHFFSCCKIQTWAHVPFRCPCVYFRKGDEPNFFIIIGIEQMGWKALFALLVIAFSIFKWGQTLFTLFSLFFLLQNSNKVRFCKWTSGI